MNTSPNPNITDRLAADNVQLAQDCAEDLCARLADPVWLRCAYVEDKASITHIARITRSTNAEVKQALETADVPLRPIACPAHLQERRAAVHIANAVLCRKLDLHAVALELGCSVQAVHEELLEHGLFNRLRAAGWTGTPASKASDAPHASSATGRLAQTTRSAA